AKIAEKLELVDTQVLAPMSNTLSKLYTYAPVDVAGKVRDAMFNAGAGDIGEYAECSFNTQGKGTFRPVIGTDPAIGEAGGERETVEEVKIEVLIRNDKQSQVLKALFNAHPYEEVAYEIISLQNTHQEVGAGMVGRLQQAMDEK